MLGRSRPRMARRASVRYMESSSNSAAKNAEERRRGLAYRPGNALHIAARTLANWIREAQPTRDGKPIADCMIRLNSEYVKKGASTRERNHSACAHTSVVWECQLHSEVRCRFGGEDVDATDVEETG